MGKVGAALKAEDISEIRKVIDERDKAFQELKKAIEQSEKDVLKRHINIF